MNSTKRTGIAALFLTGLLLLLSSCSTTQTRTASRPGSGLAEYLDLVHRSRQAVESALSSLDSLRAETGSNPKKVTAAFSDEVDRLEVASLRVRARAQAMQARGDAYFENWQQNMASIADPKIRTAAEQHRSELQQSFASMKFTSLQTRDSFQQFLTGLRKLRSRFEADPAALGDRPASDFADDTRRHGLDVLKGLDAIAAELNKMTGILASVTSTAKE
jgi:hypothetical protein